MHEPIAALLAKEIKGFRYRISGFSEPLASEFRAVAQDWLTQARAQHAALRSKLEQIPTPQAFRAGDPVQRGGEAFVPRERVVGQLERQLMLATGCPALILYGRRRMEKSTLLGNLTGFLPPSVRIANWIMQAAAFSSQASLFGLIADTIADTLGDLGPDRSPVPPGTVALQAYLDACDRQLQAADRRLLLTLDEYEYIDRKLGESVFDEELLTLIRKSIQSHCHLTWVFAGSHHISRADPR